MTNREFRRGLGLSLAMILVAFLLVNALAGVTRALAAEPQRVQVRAGLHKDYARLVFDWPALVGHSATLKDRTLRVRFDRPLAPVFTRVRRILRATLADIRLGPDGRTIVATLKGDFTARSYRVGTRIVVDLTPAGNSAAVKEPESEMVSAGAPVQLGPARRVTSAAVGAAPKPVPSGVLKISTRQTRNFGRLVFEWPRKVGFTVDRQGQSVTISFAAPAKIDLAALRKTLPSQISAAITQPSSKGLQLRLLVPHGAQLRYFHNRTSVVFDVVVRGKPRRAEVRAKPGVRRPAAKLAKKPAPKVKSEPMPPRLVSVDAIRKGAASEIRFNWRRPVSAAVYRREGRLWVVFDRPARLDLGPLSIVGGPTFAGVTQRQDGNSVHVRLPLGTGFHSTVRREGTAWVVTLSPGVQEFIKPVGLKVVKDPDKGVTLQIMTGRGGKIVSVYDPDIGDRIIAVTAPQPGAGLHPVRRFPEFELLYSDQGVAIHPLDDQVRVRNLGDRVEVWRPGGLNISPFDDNSLATRVATGDELMVDLARWRFGPVADFQRIEHNLFGATQLPKGRQRNLARFGLARFYVGHGMGAEAIGVIGTLLRDDPEFIKNRSLRALRGVAYYLTNHLAEAAADLENLAVAGVRELYPWRAAIAAARGDWKNANGLFKDTNSVIAGMPPRYAIRFGLLAAEAALSVDDLNTANTHLTALAGLPANGAELDQATYLRGHLLKKQDRIALARELWKGVIETGGREAKAKARLADINIQLELKLIKVPEAIQELEKLRFAWRNGVFEFDLLQTLGGLYADIGDLRKSLVTLRAAATYFKNIKGARALTEDMRKLFRRFYLDDEADVLRPVVALGLYNEFRELTPSGEDGDRMIHKLSERLISVDLLEQAAELLDHQVRFRLKGGEKIKAGTRLAQILLMDGRAADAIQILKISAAKDMPTEMVLDRRFMRAEALLKLKQPKQALALIAQDHNERFDLLRAQIFWQTDKWDKARLVLARLTGGFDPQKLNELEAQLLLRRAVSLRLAHNQNGIEFLRERFAMAMVKTKLGAAFKAVVGRPTTGFEDFNTLARQAAELDTFVAFMDALYGDKRKKPAAAPQSS